MVKLISPFWLKMEHKENGIYQLQQWLYIAIRKGTFGAMFELCAGCSSFKGRQSSSRWGCVSDTGRKCKWDQLELFSTFSPYQSRSIFKTICIQKPKTFQDISSWLELWDSTWNHDNGKVLFYFGLPFDHFGWSEKEVSRLSRAVSSALKQLSPMSVFRVVTLISALFLLEFWMGQR